MDYFAYYMDILITTFFMIFQRFSAYFPKISIASPKTARRPHRNAPEYFPNISKDCQRFLKITSLDLAGRVQALAGVMYVVFSARLDVLYFPRGGGTKKI